MRIVNPNYIAGAPSSIPAARWTAIQTQLSTYLSTHTDKAYLGRDELQMLFPELDESSLLQLAKALKLTIET